MIERRSFSTVFKHEAACLVLDQGYSIQEACDAVGVGRTAIHRWVKQLASERQGKTPITSRAMTPDQQRIQELEAKIRKIEREKDILKKATVGSTDGCNTIQLNWSWTMTHAKSQNTRAICPTEARIMGTLEARSVFERNWASPREACWLNQWCANHAWWHCAHSASPFLNGFEPT